MPIRPTSCGRTCSRSGGRSGGSHPRDPAALAAAGFAGGDGADRARTGVIVGNTLTGEFSRARLLRLRWPYVRRTVGAALAREGWADEERERFLLGLERDYKAPFDAIDEDTLAGGLSNTIAGRICNAFDFQ